MHRNHNSPRPRMRNLLDFHRQRGCGCPRIAIAYYTMYYYFYVPPPFGRHFLYRQYATAHFVAKSILNRTILLSYYYIITNVAT